MQELIMTIGCLSNLFFKTLFMECRENLNEYYFESQIFIKPHVEYKQHDLSEDVM